MIADLTVPVDLTSYDVIVVNSSAGKDSQAMLHYVATLAAAQGISDRVHVVHARLAEEWEGTEALAEEQAKHYGLAFHVVQRPQGTLLQHVEKRGMWPGAKSRFCTSDHKRGQVAKVITKLVKALGLTQARVLNCLGLRAQESDNRKALPAFQANKRLTNGKRVVDTWLPIHQVTECQVWDVIKASGVRHHRAYDLGMPRLSCCFCIFAPPAALLLAGKHNLALLRQYVAVEQKIGHTFKANLSLASILAKVEAGEEAGAIASWSM